MLWGGRVSLIVGITVSLLATSIGVLIGMVAGFSTHGRTPLIMRVMDGMMAIPGILLAVALMAADARQHPDRRDRHRGARDPPRRAARALDWCW